MSISSAHPLYQDTIEDITLMRDSYAGQRKIKEKGVLYLPPTPGMEIDGMKLNEDGYNAYKSYKQRAVYPDFVSTAVESLLGVMHNKPPAFELPDGMADMLVRATADGESMEGLLRRINEQQLVTGRLGALLDLPMNPDPAHPLPFIALYTGEAIRNWDESDDNIDFNRLSFVVLDESGYTRTNDFNWMRITRYRLLALDNTLSPEIQTGTYVYGVFEGTGPITYDESQMKAPPTIRGVALTEVPFVFINSKDNRGAPDNPPLLGLANAALTVYHGEADYRQALFLQGQDTLVVIGGVRGTNGDDETRVGAGAKIDVEMGGDAKYIGVSATGLPELRQALENDYKRAEVKTGQLVDTMSSEKESGEALKTRVKAQTATLHQIAKSGAAGLERLLRLAATWMGLDPSKVKVTPNLEFADMSMTGKDLVDFMTAKNMGAPISAQTVHENMVERGITKLTYDDEMALIDEEPPILGTLSGGGAPNLNAPPVPPAPPAQPGAKGNGKAK